MSSAVDAIQIVVHGVCCLCALGAQLIALWFGGVLAFFCCPLIPSCFLAP